MTTPSPSEGPRERFEVTLEALPDEVPAAVRLRALLKRALRQWRLRCVEVWEVPQEQPAREDHDG